MQSYTIRKMKIEDKNEVSAMMETFYSSNAVSTNGSTEIFDNDFENCIGDSPYLDGYVFVQGERIAGYSMVAKSFSTEFGKQCIWLEDLYLKQEFRGKGIIPEFIAYIQKLYPMAILRLEVERENSHALHVYKKAGFKNLPYVEMIKQ